MSQDLVRENSWLHKSIMQKMSMTLRYSIENHLQNLYVKSIAVVGRAEYPEQSDFIDSHSIVIQAPSNLPYPLPKYEMRMMYCIHLCQRVTR